MAKGRRRGGKLTLKYDKPDLSGWELEAFERFQEGLRDIVLDAASEALTIALKDDDHTYVSWPAKWGPKSDGHSGKVAPADPLTLYLTIALGNDEIDHDPVYAFNLRQCLAENLDECREDGSFSTGLSRIAAALRTLADDIDAAIVAGQEPGR
jgi:hypothetical protein